MIKHRFIMPDMATPAPDTIIEVPLSAETDFQSPGSGITEMMLPDGTVVRVDRDGNILRDSVQ